MQFPRRYRFVDSQALYRQVLSRNRRDLGLPHALVEQRALAFERQHREGLARLFFAIDDIYAEEEESAALAVPMRLR